MPLSSVLGAQSITKPGVCTSTTRPSSPYEGQLIYETDTDLVLGYNGSSWRAVSDISATNGGILQTVVGTYSTQVSSSSTSYADTGLTATITPNSTTSKILCLISHPMVLKTNGNASNALYMRLMRDATEVEVFAIYQLYTATTLEVTGQSNAVILDSPATTSATVYKTQFRNVVAAASVQVQQQNVTSRLVLMEIAA